MKKVIGMFMLVLVLSLPLAEALSISNVRAEQITDSSAHILWTTDQPSDSLVTYGGLTKQDNALTTSHDVVLDDLTPQQNVQFTVRSAAGSQAIEDDNNGQLYSFTTAAQDAFAPPINVAIPTLVNKAHIDIAGTTEAGAEIRLFVNGDLRDGKVTSDGRFSFNRVALATGRVNVIEFTAADTSGNTNSARFETTVDTVKPVITVSLPSVAQVSALPVVITLSEMARVQISVAENEVFNQQTQRVETTIPLQEGSNHIIITATDGAGNAAVLEADVSSDTQAPEFEEVNPLDDSPFYYEGRAKDDVRGKTEPGAVVYLFVENKRAGFTIPNVLSVTAGTTNRPDPQSIGEILKKAQYKTTADADGNFKLDDVNFEHPGFGIDDVAPEEINPGEIRSTPNTDETIQVIIIAVDASGFMTHRQFPVSIGTCATGFGVTITSLPDYQYPAILSPYRLDSGTEIISFVLNTEYRGPAAVNKRDPKSANTAEFDESYYEITQVDVRSLCREDNPFFEKDKSYEYACQLLGARSSVTPRATNIERTNWYVQYNLGASDKFTDFDDQFWKKVLKSELSFPFDISVTYTEKLPGQVNSQTRTVTLCRDVSYAVDVPIDPRKVLPDNLLQNAQKVANETIEVINKIVPTLDKVIRYAGIGCIGSFGLRTVVQVYRRFTQRWEYLGCRAKELPGLNGIITGQCSVQDFDQVNNCFYITDGTESPYPDKTTHGSFKCAQVKDGPKDSNGKLTPRADKDVRVEFDSSTASEDFPGTINAWKLEMQLYTAYRYLCDRVFCHSAPAGWTQQRSLAYIKLREYEARDCPAPSTRVLRPVDNCIDELAKKQNIKIDYDTTYLKEGGTCYQLGGSYYYVKDSPTHTASGTSYSVLKRMGGSSRLPTSPDLLHAEPEEIAAVQEGNQYRTANTALCNTMCKAVFKGKKYTALCFDSTKAKDPDSQVKRYFNVGATMDCWATTSGNAPDPASSIAIQDIVNVENECYCAENVQGTADDEKAKQSETAQFAGFDKPVERSVLSTSPFPTGTGVDSVVARKDYAESDGAWPWNYREWRIYEESGQKAGIYYPKERYYENRDFSAAFGQNYLLDSVLGRQETTPYIAHGDIIGGFQTVCLPGIRARLVALRSLLVGFQRCLKEVETSGKADAGVCKEIFSQLVCNLAYKAFTVFEDQCIPADSRSEETEFNENQLKAFIKEGSAAITDTADSMVSEVHEEYGNAQLDQFFEGGSQALMKKVCLAAFGIETGFDLDSVLDAAYTTSYETSVGVFSSEGAVGRREFLSFNPQNRNSIYEYRASWIIQPGCNLQNYQIQLAAVTNREEAQFKSVDCSAVNNKQLESNGCDNYQGVQEQVYSFANGKQVAQGTYLDQNAALVVDKSQYRYDHIKVTLYPDARQDANKCFPAENVVGRTGVFYFPIHDATPRELLQCHVETSKGTFGCSFDNEQGVGQAWFDRIECWDDDTASYKRCDRMLFTVEDEDEVRVKANIFTSGQKMCLKAFVHTENGDDFPPKDQQLWDIIGLGDTGIIPMELQLIDKIDSKKFVGDTSQGIKPVPDRLGTCTLTPTGEDVDSQKLESTVQITIEPVAGQDIKYKVRVNSAIKVNQPFTTENNYVVKDNIDVLTRDEVQSIHYLISGYGATNIFGEQTSGNKVCTIRTFKPASRRADEQNWRMDLELFYPTEDNACTDGKIVSAIAPDGTAFKTKESITLKVRNTKVSDARSAAFARGLQMYHTASNPDQFERASAEFATVFLGGPQNGDLIEVEALWWQTVSLVKALEGTGRDPRADVSAKYTMRLKVKGAIDLFESRKSRYTVDVKNTEKYKLIETYMNEIKWSSVLT